jgi:hypothetical protein
MTSKPVIVIQNTYFHFETAISLYKALEDSGFNVVYYRYHINHFDQYDLLKKMKVKICDQIHIDDCICGFVISAYCNYLENIPNSNYEIFSKLINKLIFITHRFDKEEEYDCKVKIKNKKIREVELKKENCLCLSPLSNSIGVDYFLPISFPICPNFLSLGKKINFTIPSHFELVNRNLDIFNILSDYKNIQIKLLGTNSSKVKFSNINCESHDAVTERIFYSILKNETHFLLPSIDPETKDGIYLKQRYSSNFNHSWALEKPIIAHFDFKEIYQTPGFYYKNNEELKNIIEHVSHMSNEEYHSLVFQFKEIKEKYKDYNKRILSKKIEQFI